MRAFSIRTRLFFFSTLFCFLGLLMVGGYSYYIARKALLVRTFLQLTSVREEKARQVERFFHDRSRESELAANHLAMQNLMENLSRFDSPETSVYSSFLGDSSYLLNFFSTAGCYVSLSIGLPNGKLFSFKFNSDGFSDSYSTTSLKTAELHEFFQQVVESKTTLLKDFSKGHINNVFSAYVGSPINHGNGEVAGVLILEIPERALNQLMAERLNEIGMGNTGEVYLVGSDFLMRSSSRFLENSILAIQCKTKSTERAMNGETGTARIVDYRNEWVLSSFRPIQISNLQWAIVSEMDWSEALREIIRLRTRIIIIGALVFLLLTASVFLFSSRITAPIYKLKEAALRVGDGKFDWLLPVQQRDEIGLLTQVFNKMTLRLRHTSERLAEREHRLLHFYRATIDGIMLHKDGKPVLVNRAMITLSEYSEEELLKMSPYDLFKDEKLRHEVETKKASSFESMLQSKNSKSIPVEVQRRKIFYHEQEVEGLVVRDISQRRAVEDELKVERLQRMRSVIDGQEQERQRLSRELHDGLGQTLVGIKLRLESINLDALGDERKTIELVKKMFNQTIDDTRRISNNLMPAALTEFSLAVVLRNLCTEVETNSGISVSLVVGVLPETIKLLPKTYAYRIAQEALTNTVKHSGANKAVVSIFSDINKLYLHIEDDGCGFAQQKLTEKGNGLYNMKERASLLNGRIEIISKPGFGTKINVEFPLENNSKKDELWT